MRRTAAFLLSAAWLAGVSALPAQAAGDGHHQHQQNGHQHQHGQGGASPYAGLQQREIKALSGEEIAGLLQGAGLGMALPAELNGYPGPRHVLELQHELALTPGQLAAVKAAFAEMAASAQALGEQLIAAERTLDGLFAHGKVTVEAVESASAGAAALRGRAPALRISDGKDPGTGWR